MDKKEAEKLARNFLAEKIDLKIYDEVPPEISTYPLNPEKVILINFTLFEEPHFGASKYLAISKKDGSVRYLSWQGE